MLITLGTERKKSIKVIVLTIVSLMLLLFIGESIYANEQIVYVVNYETWKDSDKHAYHLSEDCHYYRNASSSKGSMTKSQAESLGYKLCDNCRKRNYAPVYTETSTDDNAITQQLGQIENNSVVDTSGNGTVTTASSQNNEGISKRSAVENMESVAYLSNVTELGVERELLSEKQRRAKYASKTNPKMKAFVPSVGRPNANGYQYADFGRFNSYASENGLGYTPIYLLGTVMDIVPFTENNLYYRVAMLVNDCDGYQWYMRSYVNKSKLDLFKATFNGKPLYIYGGYAGYSGVLNRPMMDATIIIDVSGQAYNLANFI